MVATSFQAVSGAGVNGVAELREQTMAWSKGEAIKAKFFPHQIAFNLIPAGKFVEGGYTDEEIKLVNEIRKILDQPDLPISPTTVRVPVFTTHSISVNAETETKIAAADAREAFAHFPGIRLFDDPAQNRYPMPIVVEGQDDCFVGRIREDLELPERAELLGRRRPAAQGRGAQRRSDRRTAHRITRAIPREWAGG